VDARDASYYSKEVQLHLFLLCIHSVKSLGGNGVVTVKIGKKRALTKPAFLFTNTCIT
jgi:hypothetical protein